MKQYFGRYVDFIYCTNKLQNIGRIIITVDSESLTELLQRSP